MKRTSLLVALLAAACGGASPPAITMPSVDAHAARFFPANAGSVHAECACVDCHTPQQTSFTQYDCLSCHTGAHASQAEVTAIHTGVSNFVFESSACYGCHRNGVGVNHGAYFPIGGASAHAGVACAECHMDPANRSNLATLACASCHAARDGSLAARHTGATIPVTDYAASSPACLRCHAESEVNPGSIHPRGEDTPSENSRHRSAGCTKCHSAFRADKPYAANWRSTPGCVSCHSNGTGD
jgi:predicted CXXCH cytochrome family protein